MSAKDKWKNYRAKPQYPKLEQTYTIDMNVAPTEDPENKARMIVETKEGNRLLLWASAFNMLNEMLFKHDYKAVQVMFKRDSENKIFPVMVRESLDK